MPDLSYLQADQVVTITGDDESYAAKVSALKELATADVLNNGGEDKILTVTTSPIELKVGASRKVNRKYVIIEALDSNVKMGFSSTTQSIPIFKDQIIMMPIGENTQVWLKADSGSRNVAIGEF